MSKSYRITTNAMRKELIRLIYEEGLSIRQASLRTNIFYPTAKVINKIFQKDGRIEKKIQRMKRSKGQISKPISGPEKINISNWSRNNDLKNFG
jgi:transposase